MPGEDATDVQMPLIGLPVDAPALAALVGLRSLRLLPLSPLVRPSLPAIGISARDSMGVAVVGIDQATVALAAACARAGQNLLVLQPDDGTSPAADVFGWLAALGAQVLYVSATNAELAQAAPDVLAGSGYVVFGPPCGPAAMPDPSPQAATVDPDWWPAVETLSAAFDVAEAVGELLVVSGGRQTRADLALMIAAGRSETLALPFDDVATGAGTRAVALIGEAAAGWHAAGDDSRDGPGGAQLAGERASVAPERGDVLRVAVTRREASATQRLLAREMGLLVSERGAIGCAALIRALFEDRSRRPRERRLRAGTSALVLLPGPLYASVAGPPLAEDAVPAAPVPLADFVASPARCLVLPPLAGRGQAGAHNAEGGSAPTDESGGGFNVRRR